MPDPIILTDAERTRFAAYCEQEARDHRDRRWQLARVGHHVSSADESIKASAFQIVAREVVVEK